METPKEKAIVYEINFNGNLLTQVKIKEDKIEVLKAMNGYGDKIDVSSIKITELEKM